MAQWKRRDDEVEADDAWLRRPPVVDALFDADDPTSFLPPGPVQALRDGRWCPCRNELAYRIRQHAIEVHADARVLWQAEHAETIRHPGAPIYADAVDFFARVEAAVRRVSPVPASEWSKHRGLLGPEYEPEYRLAR